MTTPTTDKTYQDFLSTLVATLVKHHANGDEITAWMCVSQLDPTKNNKMMRDYAVNTLQIDKADFAAAMKRRRIEVILGKYPNTPQEFVEIVMEREQTVVGYNGVITQKGEAANFGLLRIKLRAEGIDTLGLRMPRAAINDAADLWFEAAKNARLPALRGMIAYDPDCAQRGYDALWRIAETCFEDDAALVVACFQKFIQQCKRKMHGLEVFKHLMLVLLGKQGGGKSVLIKKFIAQVKEMATACTFGNMTDDKIIEIWRNYIGFLDEMIGGTRADMQVVKNAITADMMTRRPMTTNAVVHVPQNLTFIGTSNAEELQEIIRDSTGTRRFVGLNCKDMLDWEVVNTTDWLTIWRSVDETAADPMAAFADVMAETQEIQRQKSRVEEWHEQYRPLKAIVGLKPGDRVESRTLFDKFNAWETMEYPGDRQTNHAWFGRMLKVVPKCVVKKAKQNGWWIFDPKQENLPDVGPTDDEDADKPSRYAQNEQTRRVQKISKFGGMY